MKKIKVFGDNVNLYEDWFAQNELIFAAELEAIRQLLPAGKGLEIGVGTGLFAEALGIEDGVEPSAKMRAKATERGINVIDAVAEELPISDQSYDFALMVTVDCFLKDISRAFQEIRRILVAEGCLIVAFINKKTPLGEMYEKGKQDNVFYKDATFHSAQEIEQLLQEAGFTIKEKRQTVYSLNNEPQRIEKGLGEGVFSVIKVQVSDK